METDRDHCCKEPWGSNDLIKKNPSNVFTSDVVTVTTKNSHHRSPACPDGLLRLTRHWGRRALFLSGIATCKELSMIL